MKKFEFISNICLIFGVTCFISVFVFKLSILLIPAAILLISSTIFDIIAYKEPKMTKDKFEQYLEELIVDLGISREKERKNQTGWEANVDYMDLVNSLNQTKFILVKYKAFLAGELQCKP